MAPLLAYLRSDRHLRRAARLTRTASNNERRHPGSGQLPEIKPVLVEPSQERLDGIDIPNGSALGKTALDNQIATKALIQHLGPRRRLHRRGRRHHPQLTLRSLLGFLHVEGLIAESLIGAVPSAASWRLSGLPRFLEDDQAQALLDSCDPQSVTGRRDLAILTLLLRLGLRAGEVAGLSLEDVDWRAGELVVVGKGRRSERLPLPVDVGEAISGYLRDGRPGSALDRTVFIRIKAPHRRLSTGGITQVVFAAGQRAGLGRIHAHRLRHTAATSMLRAGAPLAEIGQVLRHREALSTAIYAKVDRAALSSLSRPWPGAGA